MPALTKDDILQARDLGNVEPVEVPEWGGTVYVRTMTGIEQDTYDREMYFIDEEDTVVMKRENIREKLLVRTLCDENGNRIFSDGDVALLADKSAAAIRRLSEVAQRLNGMDGKPGRD
jgi:hypothetical protein